MDRFSQKIVAKVVSREGFSKNAIVTGHTRRVTSSYHVANCSNSRTEGLADFHLLVPILCPHVIHVAPNGVGVSPDCAVHEGHVLVS